MAMTKDEKARVEELETKLAFRWPTEAKPDPTVKSDSHDVSVRGWNANHYVGYPERS